jgi:hypothetical protein
MAEVGWRQLTSESIHKRKVELVKSPQNTVLIDSYSDGYNGFRK